MNTEPAGSPRSRRSVLRQVFTVAGAGLGMALLAAAPAQAVGEHCCRDSTCATCPMGPIKYKCHNNCTGATYCTCITVPDPPPQCVDRGC